MQSFWNTTSSQPILHRSKKPTSLLFLLYRETSNAVLWNHYIVNPFTIPLKSLPLKAVLLQHYITPIHTSHLYPRSLIASVLGFVGGGKKGDIRGPLPCLRAYEGVTHVTPHHAYLGPRPRTASGTCGWCLSACRRSCAWRGPSRATVSGWTWATEDERMESVVVFY